MARKSIKSERPPIQKLPVSFADTEQSHAYHPVSSGDTIALDSDITMEDGTVDDGCQTNRSNKRFGKL